MSTSDKAKQAAEEIYRLQNQIGGHGAMPTIQQMAEIIDAATAKLREALQAIKTRAIAMPESPDRNFIRNTADSALAHQQPSAHDWGDERPSTWREPSATAPDVEKIARQLFDWLSPMLPNAASRKAVSNEVRAALAQARAPLVAALTPFARAASELTLIGRSVKPEEQWLWKPSSTGRDTAGINAQHLLDARAALTGTGEK